MTQTDPSLEKLSNIVSTIETIFSYDPQLVFVDTFERISQQIHSVEDFIASVNAAEKQYWIVYDAITKMLPICERLVYRGYSDQILEFLLSMHHAFSSNLLLCASKFVPIRVQLFSVVCFAMANTEDPREKDAELFISTFKNDILQLKQLEEGNVNGLTESITTCTGETIQLQAIFNAAFSVIDLMIVHFSSVEAFDFEKAGSSRKTKRKGGKPAKEEAVPQQIPIPPLNTVQMIANSFDSPMSKADYISKFSVVTQVWASKECKLGPVLLHRLLFSFMRSGSFDCPEALQTAIPDDPIVQISSAYASKDWKKMSLILNSLSLELLSSDFQFFNEIAGQIWTQFAQGKLTDPLVLCGVLHVLTSSPNPCPMQTSLVALHYGWNLNSLGKYEEAAAAANSAISVLETFRDAFAIRKASKATTSNTPFTSLDNSYLLFERWLECIHADLFSLYFQSRLKHGLEIDTEKVRKEFESEQSATMKEREKTSEYYGTLSRKQKQEFDEKLGKKFKPPTHSQATENELLEAFKFNSAAKAIIYCQMAFFRPGHADQILSKARDSLQELSAPHPLSSPLVYVNRHEVCLAFRKNDPNVRCAVLYGKETVGSSGLTTANTALKGTGVRQDKDELFFVKELKPNLAYSFAFAPFDSKGEMIDTLGEPFTVTTCHSMPIDLVWTYLASAAYQLKDATSFDVSLSSLISHFCEVKELSEEANFFNATNPFYRFSLRPSTLSEPAPLLRAFVQSLMMAARLYSSKPLHAAAFERTALLVATVLQSPQLILSVCKELFSILQPLLSNSYHTKWVIQPLLLISSTLKANKETRNDPSHQELSARVSFSISSVFSSLYQEKPLSLFLIQSVMEMPPNPYRTSLILFAAKEKLLENNTGDNAIQLAAAEIIRTNPEKAFDEVFAKFKADPEFPSAAAYVIEAAHNLGLYSQGAAWGAQALEAVKALLKEPEDKVNKKTNPRANAKVQAKKKPQAKATSKKDPSKASSDDVGELAAAMKIQSAWSKCVARRKNLAKYKKANRDMAAISLLLSICLIESEAATNSLSSLMTERTSRRDGKHGKSKQRHREKKDSDQSASSDQSATILSNLRRAIVLGIRAGDLTTVKSAASFARVFLSQAQQSSVSYANITPLMTSFVNILIDILPLTENWTQALLRDCLLIEVAEEQSDKVANQLTDATKKSLSCGLLLWMLDPAQLSNELSSVLSEIQKRDPTENMFYSASATLDRAERVAIFKTDVDIGAINKGVGDIAISLQHKQKLPMSITLLSRLSYLLFSRGEQSLAVQRLCEALECHFRLVKAHEKIDSILSGENEESFYAKHSWSGCLSIFVISSLIALNSETHLAVQLCKLASFAISSLFSSTKSNPSKSIDFADFEPPEIVPGVDIFSEFDEAQPLLEPTPFEYVAVAIDGLLSLMHSNDLHFEMFKPVALARHFFRFIVRDKCLLARARIMGIIVDCEFGRLQEAMKTLNDILTAFGTPRFTKEDTIYQSTKRIPFDQKEPPSSQVNLDCCKSISSTANLATITSMYGFPISCQFAICVCRILTTFYNALDPAGVEQIGTRGSSPSARSKHKKSHHPKKEDAPVATGSLIDPIEVTRKPAEALLSELISKDFKAEQIGLKLELQLELASVHLSQWSWEKAIALCNEICNAKISIVDKPLLTMKGIFERAQTFISIAAYNLNDFATAEKYASQYLKSLILIRRAEFEAAALALAPIVTSKPVSRYSQEYTLSAAQLVTLFNYNKKLVDPICEKVGADEREKLNPVALITRVSTEFSDFLSTQLAVECERNVYVKQTILLVRLQLLEAITHQTFKGPSEPIPILTSAQSILTDHCPYVPHGLSFILSIITARIQMDELLSQNPNLVQGWNSQVLQPIDKAQRLTQLLRNSLSSHPDCAVHPAAASASMDLAVLIGVGSNDDGKRLERSYAALTLATAVRSARRTIQTLIASTPDTPPSNCAQLLLNDNNGLTQRKMAAVYYAHVCSLDLPLFDTSILELRTLLFARLFEGKANIPKDVDTIEPEPETLICQWYAVDAKVYVKPKANDTPSTVVSAKTTTRTTASSATSTSRAGGLRRALQSRGCIYFSLGITVEADENKKKAPRLTTILLAAQLNDLKAINDDLASVALELEEGKRMEKNDNQGDGSQGNDKSGKKRPSKSIKAVEQPSQSLLKGQAQATIKSAEVKWDIAAHKAETVFNKSNRILSSISENKSLWPSEVKISGMDISIAAPLSRFFNYQFGINEKNQPLSEWFASMTKPPEEPVPQNPT